MPPPHQCQSPPLPPALGAHRLGAVCAAATALLVEGHWPLVLLGPGHLETEADNISSSRPWRPFVHSSCTTNTTTFPCSSLVLLGKGLQWSSALLLLPLRSESFLKQPILVSLVDLSPQGNGEAQKGVGCGPLALRAEVQLCF